MGIYQIAATIKSEAMRLQMVNSATFGNIADIMNRKTTYYPCVNIDAVSSETINNSVKKNVIRIYCIDRNTNYIAFSKTELIIDELMNLIEIPNYKIQYFDFTNSEFNNQDLVAGVFVDITFESELHLKCLVDELKDKSFIIEENGDYIKSYIKLESGGRTEVEDQTNFEE